MVLTPKQFDRACVMFTTMVNKHSDELREAHFDFYKIEMFDRYTNEAYESLVPWCSMYWR